MMLLDDHYVYDFKKHKKPKRTCVCTGHRSAKLPFICNERHRNTVKLRRAIHLELYDLVLDDCNQFYIGCDEGMDIILGEEVLKIREKFPKGVRMVCVLPYRGYEETLEEPWRSRCKTLLAEADQTITLGDSRGRGSYYIRDRYMVERATDVLAVYNGGTTGSTAYTIKYAERLNREIAIFSIRNGRIWFTINEKRKYSD